MIEASEARVPLIVLTADRPPELREIGAGQTIDQIKLYGDAVRWFFEVGNHEATPERERLDPRARLPCVRPPRPGERPGPVHLNWPLREPLVAARRRAAPPAGVPAAVRGSPWSPRAPRAGAPARPGSTRPRAG